MTPPGNPTSDLTGRRVGNYHVDAVLGVGGTGSVYLAHRADGQFDRQVALKILGRNLRGELFTERFAEERRMLAGLDHPHITRLLDSGVSEDGDPYLVLEYVDGEPITQYCDSRHLGAEDRIRLFLSVCEAVEYAHGCLIHRDLKPSNILVTRDGTVKLLDFGTARMLESSDRGNPATRAGMMTPRYSSPEQLRGDTLTRTADIYSLGIVLCELLTGEWPFGDPQSASLERAVQDVEPRRPQGLKEDLWKVILQSIQPDANRRYASAGELSDDLERYLNSVPVLAHPPRSRKWIGAAAAAAAVCLFAAGYYGYIQKTPSLAIAPFTGDADLNSSLMKGLTGALARRSPLRVNQAWAKQQLSGTVERNGDWIKVVASLAPASGGARLWTNVYHRPIEELNTVAVDLDLEIAGTLGFLKPPRKKHVPNAEAAKIVKQAWNKAGEGSHNMTVQAQRDFRRALQIDPDYAQAWAGVAVSARNLMTGPAEFREAVELAQKALLLDPDLTPPHDIIASYAMLIDWDWKRAERGYRFQPHPNGNSEVKLAGLYLDTGRQKEAEEHLAKFQTMGDDRNIDNGNYADLLLLDKRFPEAREMYRKLFNRRPSALRFQVLILLADAYAGNGEAAIPKLRRISMPQPLADVTLARVEAIAGHRDEAIRMAHLLEHGNQDGHIAPYFLAQIYGDLGDASNAARYLEKSLDDHTPVTVQLRADPAFARLQDTPEFHRLKQRIGLDQ